MSPDAQRRRAGGFTIVEMVFSMAIVTVVVLLMGESIMTLSRTHAFNRAQVRITEVSDSLAQIIGRDVTTSVRIFGKDGDSSAYYDSLDLGNLQPLTGSRLPTFTNAGYFEKDAPTTPLTGNLLFLGTRGDPIAVTIVPASGRTETYRVDLLRLIVYLPMPVAKTPYHDFGRWCSVPLARASDVTAITDATKQKKVWSELYAAKVAHAWMPSMSRASGLYAIGPSGTVSLLASTAKIPADKSFTRASLAVSRHVGIAANGPAPANVPFFALPLSGKPFPGGFEVKVDGPTAGRLVLVRLVLTSVTEHGLRNYAEVRRILSCHDG